MNRTASKAMIASCRCGEVKFEAGGAPIVGAVCYCASCQEAGRRFELLPAAPAVRDPDGGTGFVLYRKDRIRCVSGEQHLQEHRLTLGSPTRRVLATCCNSVMFLDFTKGHWLTMYRNRFPDGVAPIEMRLMTQDRSSAEELADNVPNYAGHSGKFMWKLITAWVAMGFRSPEIAYGKPAG
jgi:hypothetical protein